ncbi:hypothetical protein VE03_02974 [Pseudogymnoascus sp. 23342-1-I1]|nr:hypothetical protein VE03_02974 [Pseudogymnoascus sp. 23342-1-I1]
MQAGEAGEAGDTTKVCARQRRRPGNGGNGDDDSTGDGYAETANAEGGDERVVEKLWRWRRRWRLRELALLAEEDDKKDQEEEEEVCCRQKGFDGARRAGLIDAVAWEVVERDGGSVGIGVGAGVGCKLPLGSSLLALMCRPGQVMTDLSTKGQQFSYDFI